MNAAPGPKSSGRTRLIPLARIVRVHGFPKNGEITYKADLFNTGSTILKGRSSLELIPPPESKAQSKTVKLTRAPAPHNGSWGQAKGVLLVFPESIGDLLQWNAALDRSEFPPLNDGLYLCDLMGRRVQNGNGREVGVVTAFADVAPTHGGSINLHFTSQDKKTYEFPFAWVDIARSQGDILVVPDVEAWMERE